MDIEKRFNQMISGPIWGHLGVKLIHGKDGNAELQYLPKKEHTQFHGTVHGGILATLMDMGMSISVNSLLEEDEYTVTAEMKVNYLSPAYDSLITSKSEVIKRGRNLSLCKVELYNEQNKLLCFGVGTFYLFKEKRD